MIKPAKASSYNSVTTAALVRYLREYAANIQVNLTYTERLEGANRARLKACAAALETVQAELNFIVSGKY